MESQSDPDDLVTIHLPRATSSTTHSKPGTAHKDNRIMAKIKPSDNNIQEEQKDEESDNVENTNFDQDEDNNGDTVMVENAVAQRKEEVVVAYVDDGKSGKFKSNAWQVIISLIASTNSLVMGCSMSAPGILLPALQDGDDPNIKVNLDTGANLATVWLATGTLVAGFGGWLSDRYGRRMVLILLGQPLLAASWIMTAAANHLAWMYAARVVSGVSDGLIFPLVAVYIAEISSAKMRGVLINVVAIQFCLGALVVYLLGYLLHWRTVHWVLLGVSIPSGLLMLLIPETPYFLMRKGRQAEAEKVLTKLRANERIAQEEIKEISKENANRYQVSEDDDEAGDGVEKKRKKKSKVPFFKMLAAVSLVNAMTMASGIPILFMFTITILQESGANIDPYLAAVIISLVRLLAAFSCSYIMKIYKRMTLLIGSSITIATFYCIMAIFSYIAHKNKEDDEESSNSTSTNATSVESDEITTDPTFIDYVPPICLIVILAANAVGFVPVVRVLTSEVFPTATRSRGAAVAFMFTGISLSTISRLFPVFLRTFGFYGTSIFFGCMSLASGFTAKLLLPETKDRTLTDIQEGIHGKKPKSAKTDNQNGDANTKDA